jgi:gliding motility-associated-like protein
MRFFLSLIIFTASVTWAVGQQVTINDRLAAHFSFKGCKPEDDSNNGSNGAFDGSVTCACGVLDSSIVFDGPDDRAFFVGNLSDVFTTSNFTVSFYMKPTAPPSNLAGAAQLIMAKQDGCTNNRAFWVRYRYQGQTGASSDIISCGISENDQLNVSLSAKLDPDKCWNHVVITRENTRFSLIVNGVLREQKNSTTRIDISNAASLKLSDPVCPNADGHYYGKLDELRFYNRAYTTEEVTSLLAHRPDEIINNDTLIYLGTSFQTVMSNTCAELFAWSPLNGVSAPTQLAPVLSPEVTTTYQVQFLHDDNCVSVDTIRVRVIDPDTLDCSKIFIPNAFTPATSPGRNDRFGISNPFAIGEFVSFEVFDRWGGRVYEAPNQFEGWDGTFAGREVNPGIFLYRLRFKCQGEEKVQSGTVTLLR